MTSCSVVKKPERGIYLLVTMLCAMSSLVSCGKSKPHTAGYIEPKEYPLPANNIPAETRARLHPWVAGFIGLTPAQATERLRQRWAPIERVSLKPLRETLGKFEVKAIVDYKAGGLIYAVRPGSDDGDVGNSFYLPGPLERSEIHKLLEPAKLEGNEALGDFLYYFGGLAEDTNMAGQIVYSDRPWELMTDSPEGTIEGFAEWKDALMLYHARDGTCLLVRPDGKVGWWVLPEGKIVAEAESIDEWAAKFNEHRKHAYPYDAYGIPEEENEEAKGPPTGEILSGIMTTADSKFVPPRSPDQTISPPLPKSFYFTEPEDTACITCRHVIDRTAPILRASRDAANGTWKFLCGAEGHTEDEMKKSTLGDIVAGDMLINVLAFMPLGAGATRESAADKWTPIQAAGNAIPPQSVSPTLPSK